MRKIIFISGCCILLFCSCTESKNNIETILTSTLSRFPHLPKGNGQQSEYYSLIRSVYLGGTDIEMQLRSTGSAVDDPQQIIIVINEERELFAIPFLSNTYRDYWNFPLDSPIRSVMPIQTTFEKELNKCLVFLKLDDTLNKPTRFRPVFVKELMYSLLQCNEVGLSDSIQIKALNIPGTNNLATENYDSCSRRMEANWGAIKKEFNTNGHFPDFISFWDKTNNRIYELEIEIFLKKPKDNYRVRNYRMDCNIPFIVCGSQ